MRNKAMDNIGGLLILFMILRHCLLGAVKTSVFGSVIAYYPLLFFMAWFFFKGGMYYRTEPISTCIGKGVGRLLIPYVAFSVIAVLVAIIVRGCISGMPAVTAVFQDIPSYVKREGAVECNAPLWFLLTLFLVRTFQSFADHLHIPQWLVALSSIAAGWGLYRAGLPIGLYFGNIATSMFFFSLGRMLKDIQYNKYIFAGSLAFFLAYLVYCCWTRSVVGTYNSNIHTPYFPTIAYYVAGIVVINFFFTKFPKLNNRFLEAVGRNSMDYYTTHFIIIISVLYVNSHVLHWADLPVFLVMLALEAALLPLIGRLLQKKAFDGITGRAKVLTRLPARSEVPAMAGTALVIIAMCGYVLTTAF